MTAFVEADSLSAITEIAGNPPPRPQQGHSKPRDPLVLYISRVPGTKDVILTTLKPQLKNVTAEDVASSLYYAHLDIPEDSVLIDSLNVQEEHDDHGKDLEPSIVSRKLTIARKPLPSSPTKTTLQAHDDGNIELQPPPLPRRPTQENDPPKQIFRKPLPSTPSLAIQEASPSETGARKPLIGPRPLSFPAGGTAIAATNPHPLPSPPQSNVENRRSLDTRPNGRFNTGSHLDFRKSSEFPSSFSSATNSSGEYPFPSLTDKDCSKPYSITLIRRDPTTGSQWNIGKISNCPLSSSCVRASNDRLPASGPGQMSTVFIDIENAGYDKFSARPRHSVLDCDEKVTPAPKFHRQILPEWPTLKERPSNSSSLSGPMSPTKRSEKVSRPKGWAFASPWGGRCEFFTGTGGRALKCRHVLHPSLNQDPQGQVQNMPLISELRFNLPSTNLFSLSAGEGGKSGSDVKKMTMEKMRHIRNKLSSDRHGHQSRVRSPLRSPGLSTEMSHDSDDEGDDRLDLSLGKEKAGGGNKGKRAKLGKLIIYDEGLKMLDLVVAANMGIWWRTWEP